MSKYNNSYYGSSGSSETPMRFNKRPRYGVNNSPRFPQSNQTSYNYQQNRHNSSPSSGPYQHTQYERGARNFYESGATKRPLHKQQQSNFERQNNQSSPPFLNVSRTILPSSPSPTAAAAITNRKTLPPAQTTTSQLTNTAQSNQKQHSSTIVPGNIPDQTFAYNNYFYPNYNTDSLESSKTSSYGMNYNISQYMWQTITSTPPPNLLHQPPLPQQAPPTQLPPLPGADVSPQLQPSLPPTPQSSLLSISSSLSTDFRDKSNNSRNFTVSKPVVKMKVKRKAMSSRYNASKNWSQKDAELALKAEEDIMINQHKDTILILRFPDPEINREVVKNYNPAIESVHFQLNFAPRYCFVHLKPGTDVKQTIDTLSKVPFGSGFITAELKDINTKPRNTKPCDIDPCTLYVGNLPTTIACTVLKEHFPGASRIDIGFAQRMKYTRYAFIRYPNVQLSIEAYKRMSDAEIGGRSLLLRFRRTGTKKDDQKDETENTEDLPGDEDSVDDLSLQSPTSLASSVAEIGNSIQLSQKETAQTSNVSIAITEFNIETGVDHTVRNQGIKNNEINPQSNNESNQQNEAETSKTNSNNRTANHEADTNLSVPLVAQNIKPDPDIDPDDKVVGDETITSRFDNYDQRVKQEKQMVTDFEFFAPAEHQLNGSTRNTIMNEVTSLSTITDDCDDRNETGNSLSEFLRTCQSSVKNDDDDDDATPATKKAKTLKSLLEKEIKNEPIEELNKDLISTTEEEEESSVESTAIKQEFNAMNENLNNKSVEDICNVDILPEDNFLQSIIMDKTITVTSEKETSIVPKASSTNMSNLKRQSPQTSKDALASPLLLENNTHVNNNTNEERRALHNPKSATFSNSSIQNLQEDNDDLVPNSALFLRSDNKNPANEIYDDEFFATKFQKVSQNFITPLADTIKQEPLEKSADLKCKANTTPYQKRTNTSLRQPEKLTNKQNPESFKTKPTKTTKSAVNFSNVLNKHANNSDEDDLVPENNCLLSRQSSSQMEFNSTATVPTPEIKLEKDLDDLYSTTFNKTYHERFSDKNTNTDGPNNINANCLINVVGDNRSLNLNNKENSSDNSATDTLKAKSSTQNSQNSIQNSQVSNKGSNKCDDLSDDDDDDLIIISENFPPISKATVATSSAENNFLGQSELLTFKRILTTTEHNVNSLYATIHESSRKLQHHDHLDKLFQQLDSDSDSEL